MVIAETEQKIDLASSARRWASRWPVTGTPADALIGFYKLPEDVRGVKIVDLCAGTSNFTAALIDGGANALAVDILYSDPDWLLQRRRDSFMVHYVDEDTKADDPDYIRALEDLESSFTYRHFTRSFKEHNKRYIAGSVHNLGLDDNSFDFAVSFNGVLGVTQEDYQLCQRAVEEAIRIVKPGGQVQLGPRMAGSHQEAGRINEDSLISNLKERADLIVAQDFFPFHGLTAERVTITKLT